jgi:hypothetical protein
MSGVRVFRTLLRGDGRWEVRADGEKVPRATYSSQALAWRQAKDLARYADEGTAVLHKRDGGVRVTHAYN